MNQKLLLGAAIIALMTSCSSIRQGSIDDLSGRWDVVKIDGTAITTGHDTPPSITFDTVNKKISGRLVCNNIMGNFDVAADGTPDFSQLGSTRMLCPDMAIEDSFLSAFNQVKKFGIDKTGQLILMDSKNHHKITLTRHAEELSTAAIAGNWEIIRVGDLDLSSSDKEYHALFNDSDRSFSISTGCNTIGGNYEGTGNNITFSQLRSTLMLCPDMQVEHAVKQAIPAIASFGQLAQGSNIGFYDADNNLIMVVSPLQ